MLRDRRSVIRLAEAFSLTVYDGLSGKSTLSAALSYRGFSLCELKIPADRGSDMFTAVFLQKALLMVLTILVLLAVSAGR